MYISKALESWYVEGHPLRLDLRHPLLKLAGEAGELLDLYGKDEYKPEFSWWNCKKCGMTKEYHETYMCDYGYTPLVLDELGDYWYYLRIVSFIGKQEIDLIRGEKYINWDIDKILATMAQNSCVMLTDYLYSERFDISRLRVLYGCLESLLDKLNCTIDELTELNYKKLNSDSSQHGWASARQL